MRHFPLSAAKRHLRHLDATLPGYGREQRARLQTFVSGKARLKIAMRIPHIFRIIITTVYLSCDYVIKFLRLRRNGDPRANKRRFASLIESA